MENMFSGKSHYKRIIILFTFSQTVILRVEKYCAINFQTFNLCHESKHYVSGEIHKVAEFKDIYHGKLWQPKKCLFSMKKKTKL